MANSTLEALRPAEFDYWKAHHLLSRAGFGGTPGQVRALANLGLEKAVDSLLDYRDQPYREVAPGDFDGKIIEPPDEAERRARMEARRSGSEAALEQFRRMRQAQQQADRRQMSEIQRWWLTRMIETPRPLEERMTLFWHGHFATGYRTIEDSYHMFLQNIMFRRNAVGSFRELAHGIIHDPAMLRYLNNNQNRRESPNENLARELMELFTLGEGHGYTEDDIKEGARALTGYTYEDDEFVFRRRMHDDGVKRILGRTGPFDGDDFVQVILDQPAASEYLCLKLYRFFVNDLPGGPDPDREKFIRRLAARLRENDFALGPVLKALFRSEHFYDPSNVAARIKGPVELLVQAIRTLRTPVRSLDALLEAANLMGQNLFFPPSVKGWDGGRAWINTATLFVRQNAMIYLLTGRRPDRYRWEQEGPAYDPMHLVEDLRRDDGRIEPADAAFYLLKFALGAEPHHERVRALVEFVEGCGGHIDRDVLIGLLSLVAAMPEYQLC